MPRWLLAALFGPALVAACTSFAVAPGGDTPDGGSTDAGGDGSDALPSVSCNGAFTTPALLVSDNFDAVVSARKGTATGTVYLSWDRSPDTTLSTGTLDGSVLQASVGNLVSELAEGAPIHDQSLAVDETELAAVFATNRTDDSGAAGFRLFGSTRPATNLPFADPRVVLDVPLIRLDEPWISGDELYFTREDASGLSQIVRSRRQPGMNVLLPPEPVGLPDNARHPVLSGNRLEIYFSLPNPENGRRQVVRATRPNVEVVFDVEGPLPVLNDFLSEDYPTWLSPDGCEIWMISDRANGREVYRSTRR